MISMVKLSPSEYELSDKADWLQRQINSLNVSKYALEENLSSSHRAQSADNQNKA